jgi:hypothetical protein
MAASSLRFASEQSDRPTWTVAELIRAATAGHAVPETIAPPPESPEHAWVETLELVERATETVLVNEKRLADLENDNRELETRLAEEVRSLRVRMDATNGLVQRAEAALQAAEARAERAEARAAAAEQWLARIRQQALLVRRT